LPVMPPPRIYSKPNEPEFMFCHNDLGGQIIFVNPETYKIVGIIDWEYVDYWPENF